MDRIMLRQRILEVFRKYRFAILILVVGAALMLIPENGQGKENTDTERAEVSLAGELTQILGQVNGVGKVQVMLTVSSGELTVYQYDEDIHSGESGSVRKETVIVTNSDRQETGLVQQIIPPSYLGAIVVCQGADSAAVRLAVVEAVSKVTGLSSDRISVLKMN